MINSIGQSQKITRTKPQYTDRRFLEEEEVKIMGSNAYIATG